LVTFLDFWHHSYNGVRKCLAIKLVVDEFVQTIFDILDKKVCFIQSFDESFCGVKVE